MCLKFNHDEELSPPPRRTTRISTGESHRSSARTTRTRSGSHTTSRAHEMNDLSSPADGHSKRRKRHSHRRRSHRVESDSEPVRRAVSGDNDHVDRGRRSQRERRRKHDSGCTDVVKWDGGTDADVASVVEASNKEPAKSAESAPESKEQKTGSIKDAPAEL